MLGDRVEVRFEVKGLDEATAAMRRMGDAFQEAASFFQRWWPGTLACYQATALATPGVSQVAIRSKTPGSVVVRLGIDPRAPDARLVFDDARERLLAVLGACLEIRIMGRAEAWGRRVLARLAAWRESRRA